MPEFCAFILTHGRPDRVVTYDRLIASGYTGPIYLLIDNEDKTADDYRLRYGEQVVMFDKKAIAETFDEADNFDDRRAIVYARNACFQVARDLGFDYFIQLDDDYTTFQYRYNSDLEYEYHPIKSLDDIFASMVQFLKDSGAHSLAMAQGGDFIGGENSSLAKKITLTRKCMNTFVCATDRPFKFVGRINEDVNTYTHSASKGLLLFTFNGYSITQKQTQSNAGGMTDIYLNNGTYVKSFYTVIFQPSSVKVGVMGDHNMRLHHRVTWDRTVPKILREEHKRQELSCA